MLIFFNFTKIFEGLQVAICVAGECTERAFVSGLLIQKLRIQKGAR
jgi:hypothetical protein